ncbi:MULTISPECIES: hypothetical protein [Bradyrhizobium]|nr:MULTISPECIES: hypothetical protein [Bradyrhizobium]KRQ05819.1 hypothetical protein AOQ73_14710 [Bradyrhizobium pachyrhizi]NLS71608.1 hypothetical protein [Bradyrhizobium brasilense]OMI11907.1 hypothetical protein BSN85_10595 [Bradyrhizobium brasilense]
MPSTFTHRGVTFDVKRLYDDQFEIIIEIGGETTRHTVRTRLAELAKRRAEMLIDRKLKTKIRPV